MIHRYKFQIPARLSKPGILQIDMGNNVTASLAIDGLAHVPPEITMVIELPGECLDATDKPAGPKPVGGPSDKPTVHAPSGEVAGGD